MYVVPEALDTCEKDRVAIIGSDGLDVISRWRSGDEEFDTIGGLVINAFGQLPTRNQSIRLDQFEFKVIHANERRLTRLRVTTEATDATD